MDSRKYLECKLMRMRKIIFYEKSHTRDNKIIQECISRNKNWLLQNINRTWEEEHPNQRQFVMKYAQSLTTEIEQDYSNNKIIVKIIGMMTEKDYIFYRLKY